MPVNISRVIVSVDRIDDALPFYRDLLGLEPALQPGFARAPLGHGAELLLHERPSAPSDTAVAVTFEVAELDELCARWEAADGVIVDPPADQPWGERMAVVRDADGHLVCLVEAA